MNHICWIGACFNRAEYKCPSCHRGVCENHAAAHICTACYEKYLREKQDALDASMCEVDFA